MCCEGTRVVLSIGSNCGNREGNVSGAIRWLKGRLRDMIASEIYETPPVGHSTGDYMNAVVAGRIDIAPDELERSCKMYEFENGRDSKAREAGQVPIDIDIVIIDDEVVRKKDFNSNFFKTGYRMLS